MYDFLKLTAGEVVISVAAAIFPGETQKGKSSHDIEYGHGQEKRRPSTYVDWGKLTTKTKQVFEENKCPNLEIHAPVYASFKRYPRMNK